MEPTKAQLECHFSTSTEGTKRAGKQVRHPERTVLGSLHERNDFGLLQKLPCYQAFLVVSFQFYFHTIA